MNKKGFTLIELLAVVVIVSLLILLASKGIAKIVKDNKKDIGETQEKLIIEAAQLYMEDDLNSLPGNGKCVAITLDKLKLYFNNFSDLKTNKDLTDEYFVNVCNNNDKIEYELMQNG